MLRAFGVGKRMPRGQSVLDEPFPWNFKRAKHCPFFLRQYGAVLRQRNLGNNLCSGELLFGIKIIGKASCVHSADPFKIGRLGHQVVFGVWQTSVADKVMGEKGMVGDCRCKKAELLKQITSIRQNVDGFEPVLAPAFNKEAAQMRILSRPAR